VVRTVSVRSDFFVHSKIYKKFCESITTKVKQLRQGASIQENVTCDFGAMTMPAQVEIVEKLVGDATKKGAKLLTGGKRLLSNEREGKSESKRSTETKDAFYYPPTILADVTQEMKIAKEEAFGPVMTIMKFDDEKQLITMVNSTEYGLGSCVFTTDLSRAARIGRQIESGMVCVNDYGLVPMVQSLPFGGCKKSGFGVFNGYEGLRGFSRMQSIVTDRWPGVRTHAPPFLRYPIWPNSHEIIKEAVQLVYGPSYLRSLKALVNIVRLILQKKEANGQKNKKVK